MKAIGVFRALLFISIPLVLVLSWVCLLLTPVFINWEYRRASFPPDPYGFTVEDRLHWADISRQYLVNNQGIDFLANQRLSDGSPLYNARELRHMSDVKGVVHGALILWVVSLIVALASVLYLSRKDAAKMARSVQYGAVLTIVLLAGILALVTLAWDQFFVDFHHLFFQGNSWLFSYSDSLIRLFPVQFWQDCFLTLGIGSALCAIGLWLLARWGERRLAHR
ncbi:MAG: TIGR01906 family membrane protein [Anaerolineales bacterium]|jgi:integral membrane protein (TIGR01906 family)